MFYLHRLFTASCSFEEFQVSKANCMVHSSLVRQIQLNTFLQLVRRLMRGGDFVDRGRQEDHSGAVHHQGGLADSSAPISARDRSDGISALISSTQREEL